MEAKLLLGNKILDNAQKEALRLEKNKRELERQKEERERVEQELRAKEEVSTGSSNTMQGHVMPCPRVALSCVLTPVLFFVGATRARRQVRDAR